jgi:hypothetical protein
MNAASGLPPPAVLKNVSRYSSRRIVKKLKSPFLICQSQTFSFSSEKIFCFGRSGLPFLSSCLLLPSLPGLPCLHLVALLVLSILYLPTVPHSSLLQQPMVFYRWCFTDLPSYFQNHRKLTKFSLISKFFRYFDRKQTLYCVLLSNNPGCIGGTKASQARKRCQSYMKYLFGGRSINYQR